MARRTIYNVCPRCGANLDPGERCICKDHGESKREFDSPYFEQWEQMKLVLRGKENG